MSFLKQRYKKARNRAPEISKSMSVPVKIGLVDKVRAHLELLDPVTWISVFPCLAGGVMASGAMQPTVHDYLLLLAIFLMFGPLGTGFSQSVNDYFDLELDRVNEPSRPIPSGRLTEMEALGNSVVALLLSMPLVFCVEALQNLSQKNTLMTGGKVTC